MAKLTGVKTIDMVNGEITKIEHGGVEYVRHSKGLSEAMTGDLFLSEGSTYTTSGEFYEITIDKNRANSVRYIDDVGDNDGYRPECPIHTLFRKQSVPTLIDRVASLEQRVDSLEGKAQETYRLITDREPKVGDFVKFDIDGIDITAGKYYELQDSYDGLCFLDDGGDLRRKPLLSGSKYADHHDYFEKVRAGETITHNGATYTLVDRKAQPGDVVEYENGFTTKVYGYFRDELRAYNRSGGKGWKVYGGIHPIKVYAPVAPKVEPLKVGDYAKVVYEEHGHEFNSGDIIELTGEGYDPNFEARRLIDGEVWFVDASEVVRATDEEVTQAKAEAAQQAELARWAAIGRKPNEYKKGDIVRIINSDSTQPNGEIGEVTVLAGDSFRVKTITREFSANWQGAEGVELITPVEARFDVTDRA
ncbi:hypothetical protein HYI36_20205 [Bacillus sp. Gen3]|nr:hypothetical protein [Bacillus sp. Gen3]